MLGLSIWSVEAERGRDQRRELLNIRTHDDDVPGFEGWIVGKQADEHLSQHLHLTIGAVTSVELHAVVSGCEKCPLATRPRRAVRRNVGLQLAEQ
jgi:hypothetical protein